MRTVSQLMDEPPFVEGYYICTKIEGRELYVSPTLFETELKAQRWMKRYQLSNPRFQMYLKPNTVERNL